MEREFFVFPTSFAQQRLWFLDQYEPGSAVYNIPGTLRLVGKLNVCALEQSLKEIIGRHETLRTTFSMAEGEPVQVISAASSISLHVIDLTDRIEADRKKEARRLAHDEARRPFDLSKGPLLRATLIRLGEQDHILVLTLHHIVSDGWSMGVLHRELSVLYQAFSNSEPSSLADLPIQYADYAVWQREWLQGEILQTQISYWKKQLEGIPAVLNLPTDHPRPAVRSYRGGRRSIQLSAELTQGLKALGRKEGVTLFMTLSAAFQTLLHRYTGQDDIVIGCPIANRNRAEIEGLIGFFVNTLVLRTNFAGDPTFKELLGQVRETALGAYAHQDLPFEKLVEELKPERSLSHSPLFQVMFVLQNAPTTAWQSDGLSVSPQPLGRETAKFDLLLSMAEDTGRLSGSLEYSIDLFEGTTIERFLAHFQSLLKAIIEQSDQRISALPLLTQAEQDRLLIEWNDTKTDSVKNACAHQLFEEQAEKTPDAIAVVFENQQLSYQELNHQANKVAHYLQRLGVGPEVLVGVSLERSLKMVVGILGILKAGGAYVPLDPSYPKARLAFMVEDSGAPVLLTQERLIERLPEHAACVVCLDRDWEKIAKESDQNLDSQATAENLVYVSYTSGSTGRPKGIAMSHHPLCNLLSWQLENFTPPLPARTLQFASLSFDVSFQEIFSTWCSGGTLVLIPEELRRDPRGLLHCLQDQSVERLFLPFVALHQLAEVADQERAAPKSLREIITAGEQLHITPPISALFSRLNDCQLRNQYGPSETHVVSVFTPVGSSSGWPPLPPIGQPIANSKIYILDRYQNSVPIGVTGELWIGGTGLARGYLNRAELTAENFIPDPFSDECGARLYRTGDLARYLSDGNIEFLGRIDHQVKIRGFRIELGEVEAVLSKHPAVRQTEVVTREDVPGNRRLVAYVVPHKQPACTTTDLWNFLKQQLPEYMVPSAFVFLNSLPLTPNGKVDRNALPVTEQSRPELAESFVASRTPIEEIIAVAWAEVLQLEKVGIHDNFFELGGHSLLATRAISRIRQALRVELPLRALFEKPTVAGLAERAETLRGASSGSTTPLLPVGRDWDLPLSFAQERLWFLDQYEPGSAVYNIPGALRLRGSLDVSALEQSLNEIIRRHEALRTTFSVVEGEPMQVISSSVSVSLHVVDLTDRPETQREEESRGLSREEARRAFDLSQGSLFRSTLIRLGEQDHVLLLTMHHIVSDGWSMGVFFHELSVLYDAFTHNQPSPLSELPIQYADYAVWQRQWLKGEILESQLSYWKQQLKGIPAVLNLPADHPRPAVQSFRGKRQSIELSKELTQGLKALSRKEDVTLFMTLLAAFQTLLYRYSGQEDIVVGSPIANRNRAEIEGLIGFFVNTLVLRTNFSGNPSFKELLSQVRETALGAYAHQDLPFEKLVEELQPERSLNHSPLFQVMFAYQNTPKYALRIPGVFVGPVEKSVETTKFDLHLFVDSADEGIRAALYYATDLYDDVTIARLLGHFRVLLEGIVANPDRQLSELPILTEAEEHQLLIEWNDTKRDYPKDKCLHQWFEEQVEMTPDALAVVFENQHLTYRDLNRRANQLAHYLRKQGVGPEVLVGICIERSLEMVVGLLGILKAGGAYVPLDAEYPKERLAFMLEDTRAPVLLTQQRWMEGLPVHSAQVVCLDRDWEEIAQQSEESSDSQATAGNLAYVIYTSGSTGKPKGVMNTHHGISNRLLWMQDAYHLTQADRVLQKTPFCFDVSVWEFFWPLINGARLVVALPGGHQDPDYLVKRISEQKVTTLHFVPSMMRSFLEVQGLESCNSLRLVICSGEALPFELQERFFACSGIPLHNLYGPTEASVDVTSWNCERVGNRRIVPIGRPIANTQIYLLDSYLRPVPIGVSGELDIGGAGLARGYLNRPELTAEKFIPDPFSSEVGARLYKSGDLARYLPGGEIEFLGRIDHQVKIRGFRIELGEIEAVLSQHPVVRETVVLAREEVENPKSETCTELSRSIQNLKSDKRLVAYVVCTKEQACTTSEVRDFLKQKLPEYMVPSEFVFLEAMPLTPNGKVDRKALPLPDQSRPELEESFASPRTPVEELLANIWAEVLKLEKVGVHDNFFELGGHSLLAIQVISRIRERLLVELSLRRLFEAPTVAGVAEHIESARQNPTGLRALPMVTEATDGEYPLSFSQERFWFLEQLAPNNLAYHVTYGFRLIGPLNIEALEKTLSETVRRHETLRTTFQLRNGKPVQLISERWSFPLKIIDLRQQARADSEAEVERLFENERQRSFDLSADLLLRATLLQVGADEDVLILSTHHIAWDHWSIEILFREFAVLYQAYAAGKPSPFPYPTIQYRHYALWQRKVFDHAGLQNHLAYWKEQLCDAPHNLNLPTDHPRKPLHNRRGRRQSVTLPERLSDELKTLSRRSGVTFFMLVLAAFQTLLHRLSGQDDIVVGTPVAGRDRSETEGLIGLFLNTLVLRTKLSGNLTFFQLLQKVREVVLGAYDRQDLPFEKLVEELQPERDLSRTPIFQVFVNMYNFKEASFQLDQLRVDRLNVSKPAPQFDLELYVRERDDGTHLTLVYDSDLFEFATIAGMLGQYRHLLEQIVAGPEKPIKSYSLVTPESRSLLPDPSAVLAEPPQQLVTSIFTSWAQQTPDDPAVNQGKQTWTYDELAERADNLARLLRATGLERGDVVAICGRRSFGLIAGIVGTLLSGGVLLPIDHTLPNQRKQLMLKEARAKVLLYIGDKRSEDAWLEGDFAPGILVVDPTKGCFVDAGAGLDSEPASLPELSPEDPAYIFFTSGTTGVPKGVLGCHKSLSHFLTWQRKAFAIRPKDRIAQLTSLSFDPVLRDIFLPLISGATLCLPEVHDHTASDEIIAWLEREQISVLHTVPSVAQSWLANLAEKISLSSLRRVFFVGEPLSDALVRRWRAALQNKAEIINLYGPTETTLVKCFYRVPTDSRHGVQPVGWPIPDTQALVLSENNQLCGINEPGEIVLRTPFRSLGYINAPEENRKRFVKNPFRDDAHDLIYFTGDAGRYAPDGTLEILGRLDDQVKIRGVRIEPAEVTAILAQHPLVDSCIVVAKKNGDDDSSLVAYLVASKQGQPTSTQLRSYLLEQLPVAMLPSAFILLDSLPLTSNGKVDRKALAALDHNRPDPEESFVAPRTALEKMLVAIWAEVLKSNRVGIHDNFFQLGGHSLLATQLVSRIRGALEVELPLRALFEKPTVADLSDHIESVLRSGKKDSQISKDNLGEMEEIVL